MKKIARKQLGIQAKNTRFTTILQLKTDLNQIFGAKLKLQKKFKVGLLYQKLHNNKIGLVVYSTIKLASCTSK